MSKAKQKGTVYRKFLDFESLKESEKAYGDIHSSTRTIIGGIQELKKNGRLVIPPNNNLEKEKLLCTLGCGIFLGSKTALKVHKNHCKKNLEKEVFSCKFECGKVFPSKYMLNRHAKEDCKKNPDKKNFLCVLEGGCGKSFTKSGLKYHMKKKICLNN